MSEPPTFRQGRIKCLIDAWRLVVQIGIRSEADHDALEAELDRYGVAIRGGREWVRSREGRIVPR